MKSGKLSIFFGVIIISLISFCNYAATEQNSQTAESKVAPENTVASESEVTVIEKSEIHGEPPDISDDITKRIENLAIKIDQMSSSQSSLVSKYIGVASILITSLGLFFAFIVLVFEIRKTLNELKEAKDIISNTISQAEILKHDYNQLKLKTVIIESLASGNESMINRMNKTIAECNLNSSLEDGLKKCINEIREFEAFKLRCLMLQWGDVKSQMNAARYLGQNTLFSKQAIKVIDEFMLDVDSQTTLYDCLSDAKKNLERM